MTTGALAWLALPSRVMAPRASEFGITGLLKQLAEDLIGSFFKSLGDWVTTGTTWVLGETWRALSATTEPILTGAAFDSEYHVMVLIALGSVLPLLGLAVIQAIAHQDASGLLRTALLRLPMAVLLTGVVIEIVSLGLTATDQASSSLLATGDAPAAKMFAHLEAVLPAIGGGVTAFGGLLLLAVVATISFVLWLELAVRSAGVAVAALFLPLALAGLVWPATSHWARRLGETLAALVLMKLVMAAILALTAGALAASTGGVASVVEGVALLGLTASSPFALFRLVPMVEGGAVSHLEGVRPGSTLKSTAGSFVSSSVMSLVGGGAGAGGGVAASAAASAAAEMLRYRGGSLDQGTAAGTNASASVGVASSAGVVGGVSGGTGVGSTGAGSSAASRAGSSASPAGSGTASPSAASPAGSGIGSPSAASPAGSSTGSPSAGAPTAASSAAPSAGLGESSAATTSGGGGSSSAPPSAPLTAPEWSHRIMTRRPADGGDAGN